MNILRLAGEVFLLYLLYKLIFDFIIPIYQTSKKVKRQFGEMHSKMQEQMNQYNGQSSQQTKTAASAKPENKKEEYIDYEEIKEQTGNK
ncbi:MAG: hypothetical protein ABJA71_04950 [Ginsengibacter sp.]